LSFQPLLNPSHSCQVEKGWAPSSKAAYHRICLICQLEHVPGERELVSKKQDGLDMRQVTGQFLHCRLFLSSIKVRTTGHTLHCLAPSDIPLAFLAAFRLQLQSEQQYCHSHRQHASKARSDGGSWVDCPAPLRCISLLCVYHLKARYHS